jgi:hypothetical protein
VIFTNPAGSAAAAAPAYVRALLDLLVLRLMGGHDLVHRRQIDRVLAAAGTPRVLD